MMDWNAITGICAIIGVVAIVAGGFAFWGKIIYLAGTFTQMIRDVMIRLGLHRAELDRHEKQIGENTIHIAEGKQWQNDHDKREL